MLKSIKSVLFDERTQSFINGRFEVVRQHRSYFLHDLLFDLFYKLEPKIVIYGDKSGLKASNRTHTVKGPNGELQLVRDPAFLISDDGCAIGVIHFQEHPWKLEYESRYDTSRKVEKLCILKEPRKQSPTKTRLKAKAKAVNAAIKKEQAAPDKQSITA